MKTFFFICLFLFTIASASRAQVIDAAPSGSQNIRAVLGGGERVTIDSKTSLIDLIQRLEKPWQFVETYKAYWIGYTDLMYSIANYKESAIPLLTNFIDTAKNFQARLGGLYTLHLIGINSEVVGRFMEDFSNKKAREAILRYLNNESLHYTVVSLLMRDPWLSDLPEFMKYLSVPNRDHSKIISALRRYDFDGKPLEQKITDTVYDKVFSVNTPENANGTAVDICALMQFQKAFAPRFTIDTEITGTTEWKSFLNKDYSQSPLKQNVSFEFLYSGNLTFLYSGFDDYFFTYKYSDEKIEIIGPVKARQIWLDWWGKLSEDEKRKFYSFAHLPIEERFKRKN
jgi:hypothetical protein